MKQKVQMMTWNGINLVISTVWRDQDYLGETLDSLSVEYPIDARQPVCLVAGSPVTTHLDHHRSRPGITVVEMGPNTWSWIKNNCVTHRATWNYYRCLTQPTAGSRGSLVLEDDVRFARGWRTRFDVTVTALEEIHGSDFILAIYAPWYFVLEEYYAGRLYVAYSREMFYGTQGVYYTAKTRQGFAKYLKAHGVVADEKAYDYLLRDYLLQSGTSLFASTPSLIQHTGEKSAIQGPWYISHGFVEEIMALSPGQW